MRPLLLAVAIGLFAPTLSAQTAKPLTGSGPPALSATTPTSVFRALLSELPASILSERLTVDFGDLSQARGLDLRGVEGANRDPHFAQTRALMQSPLTNNLSKPRDAWFRTVGFRPLNVMQVLIVTNPDVGSTLMRLEPGAAATVPPAFEARGFVLTEQNGVTAWARGEDYRIDLGQRNTDDPFGGALGRASRVQIDGDLIRQGAAWSVMALFGDAAAAPMATDPRVAALLDAADGVTGSGALVAATILTAGGELGLGDPQAILTGAQPPGDGQTGAWGPVLFADFSSGGESTGVLALTVSLSDATAADALRAHAARAWAERTGQRSGLTMAELTGGQAEVTVHPAAPGQWVLRFAQSGPTEIFAAGLTRNRAYTRLFNAAIQRDLPFLQP